MKAKIFILIIAGFVLANAAFSAPSGNIIEISARVMSGQGDSSPIVGFRATNSTGPVLGRAMGPSLAQFGVKNPMPNPSLSLYNQDTKQVILKNSDWATDATELRKVAADVGAFPFTSGLHDAGFTLNLPTGLYSYVVQPKDGVNGVVLLELYKNSNSPTGLPNISCRGISGDGENVMIIGFVVGQSSTVKATRVLLRGIGPGLKAYGVQNTAPAVGIRLFQSYQGKQWVLVPDSTGELAWKDASQMKSDEFTQNSWSASSSNASVVAAYSSAVGAFPLASGSGDSAIVLDLFPGQYTLEVVTLDGSLHNVLGEAYDATVILPPSIGH